MTLEPTKIPCKPFLKWVGGKQQLLPELIKRLPTNYHQYFEPFIGGGALFFHVQPPKAILSDINPDLVNVYLMVKNQVNALIEDLAQYKYESNYYYHIRNLDRTADYQNYSDIQKASRLIYLNKTGYNGLYRVNSKGQFNVPFGCYKNPKICDRPNLLACHQVLQSAEILEANFLAVETCAKPGDFVYFDPPYAPLTATSNFTSYAKHGFTEQHQQELKDLCDRLNEKQIKFMLSNSAAPLILDLYQNYHIETVKASRAINSQGNKRGKIDEVIVTNYQLKNNQ